MSLGFVFKYVVFTFEFDNPIAKVQIADCYAH